MDQLGEGTEVEACGLVNNAELNGLRGYVVGQQRAPDGTVLVAVRLQNDSTRLFQRHNLMVIDQPTYPDLSGVWGCWYGSPHVFQQNGDLLTIMDTSTGSVFEGYVSKEPIDRDASNAMRVIPAAHKEGWQGPLDEHRQDLVAPPDYNAKKRKPRFPWTPQRGRRIATVHAMGTVGAYDGHTIAWKSGTLWKRRTPTAKHSPQRKELEQPQFSPTHMGRDEFIM